MASKRKQSETLKEKGNAAFKAGRYAEAVAHYSDAIAAAGAADDTAALYSNRSFALLQLKDYRGAARDAYQCVRIDKQWPKGYYRLGLAMSGLRLYTKGAKRVLEFFKKKKLALPHPPTPTHKQRWRRFQWGLLRRRTAWSCARGLKRRRRRRPRSR